MTGPVRLLIAAVILMVIGPTVPAFAEAAVQDQPFEGHVVARFEVESAREMQALFALNLMPWSCRPSLAAPDFTLSPEQRVLVDRLGMTYQVMIPNVQELIDAEAEAIEAVRQQQGGVAGEPDDWFAVYRTTAEVSAYTDELVALRPDLVERFTVGLSIEGRTIFGMRITAPGGSDKPAVLFNGMQHSREWVAVMVPMYIADRLVRGYDEDPRVTELLDNVVVYVVPIVNPDGYEFSQLPGNRMWRKNRRNNPGSQCFGVDLNRNWGTDWNGGQSTSNNPCSDVFVGSGPFSEPEASAMSAFIGARPYIAAHVDYHSFSELILQPWGYTNTPHEDFPVINALGAAMSEAIYEVHGKSYPHGSGGDLLYLASGIMPDWVTSQGAYGYTIELRPATQNPGFVLPPEQILPTCEENWPAALIMAEWVAQGAVLLTPGGLPEWIAADGGTTVQVYAAPISSGPLDPGTAQLYFRVGDAGEFMASPMVHLGGASYEAVFPSVPCGAEIEFFFEIESEAGKTYRAPADAPGSVYSAQSVPVIFSDNFDENIGWVAGAPDDDATTGHWEWGTPIGTTVGGQQVQPNGCLFGDFCWFTGQHTPGKGAGFNDVDNGKTTLFSPIFDLSGLDEATVSYWRWYSNHAGANPHNDIFEVDISPDGGASWVSMEVVGPGGPETTGGWYYAEYQIEQFVVLTEQVQVRFIASDYDPQALVEAAIDMFQIASLDCGPEPQCPADLNGDGSVGVADLLIMLAAWGECPPSESCPADLTGDGNVGVADLLELLSQWGECD